MESRPSSLERVASGKGPFKAPASSFYLFPTSFHSEARLLKPDAENAYHKASPQQSLYILRWPFSSSAGLHDRLCTLCSPPYTLLKRRSFPLIPGQPRMLCFPWQRISLVHG